MLTKSTILITQFNIIKAKVDFTQRSISPTKVSIITEMTGTNPFALLDTTGTLVLAGTNLVGVIIVDGAIVEATPVQGGATVKPLHCLTPKPRYGAVQQPILKLKWLNL